MSLEALLERQQANTDPSDILHWFCECQPVVKALCGLLVDPAQIVDDTPLGTIPCVVCVALMDKVCPRCGT